MRTLLTIGLVLTLAACSVSTPDADGDDAAATCLAGDPDCVDDPTNGEGGGDELPADLGDVTIADLLDGGPGGTVTVAGYLVAEGDQARLCEALAESFPPQCGGLWIPVDGMGEVELEGLPTEGDVTWSDFPITLQGEMVDGVLVVG